MDLAGLTRQNLDDRLRLEAGVDLLAGRGPATRLVLFDRRHAVLVAAGRARRAHEEWWEPMVDLLFLARTLRPRAMALSLPLLDGGSVEGPMNVSLLRYLLERGTGRDRVSYRELPFTVSDDGLAAWGEPRHLPAPPGLDRVARQVMRRPPVRQRRNADRVAQYLIRDGHRLDMTPDLAERLAQASSARSDPGR
jgi:hypothetical protein